MWKWLLFAAGLAIASSAWAVGPPDMLLLGVGSKAAGGGGPTFQQCVNFRQTSGFVTDPNHCAFEGTSPAYPHAPSCNGCASAGDAANIGWNAQGNLLAFNANSGADARIAGVNYLTTGTGTQTYEILTPGAGTYSVNVAMGRSDGVASTGLEVLVLDGLGGSTLATIGPDSPSAGSPMMAADGASYTTAAWASTGAGKTVVVTTTGTIIAFKIDSASNTQWLSHIGVCNTASCTPP